jgi:hypothetical protein
VTPGFIQRLRSSPVLSRVIPFLVVVAITALQGRLGEDSRFWLYLLKTLVGGWLLWLVWPVVEELRWEFSWRAVVVGALVFGIWVGLDPYYPKLQARGEGWDPLTRFGESSAAAWFFVVVRFVGSVIVVPPLEEVFYRSFLYRYVVSSNFLSLPLSGFRMIPFLVVAVIFGLAHHEWLAGFLCGCCYQGLVCWRGRLGEAVAAHAVTNLLLGVWVVARADWHFW